MRSRAGTPTCYVVTLCLYGWSDLRRPYRRVFTSRSADRAVNLASWRHCTATLVQLPESLVVIWADSSHQAGGGGAVLHQLMDNFNAMQLTRVYTLWRRRRSPDKTRRRLGCRWVGGRLAQTWNKVCGGTDVGLYGRLRIIRSAQKTMQKKSDSSDFRSEVKMCYLSMRVQK